MDLFRPSERTSDTDDAGAGGGVRRGTRGQRKRWPPTIRFSPARSFTYSLSSLSLSLSLSFSLLFSPSPSLVSILSPLCVLLIYRAAGKCLRHSPSIVQPISLLFFLLLLHLRASSLHFLFPSPCPLPPTPAVSLSSYDRFAPFSPSPLRIPLSHTPPHRPEYID